MGIRGWSFGGYLAALAVLRRPDVFHAAVAARRSPTGGCMTPTTPSGTWGTRTTDAGAYDASSLLDDARKLSRPLLLIHGLADDNVVVAHSLRLSSALLRPGRPH